MSMSTLLAIDPCAEVPVSTTGWARIDWNNAEFKVVETGVVPGGFDGLVQELSGQNRPFGRLLVNLLDADTVVCEHFVKYKAVADVTPLLAEGAVRLLRPDVVLQPSSAMQYVPDAFLRANGWYSKDGHHRDANSALKHAFAYLRALSYVPVLRALTS